MKHSFKSLALLFVALFASVNCIWADDETAIYLASLKAQKSPASTGDGQVKLTWLDITGKPMEVEVAKQINYMAFSDPTILNKEYVYDGFGETAQLAGGTLIAIDGMETSVPIGGAESQIYMTSFLYFHAEAAPANGSYLSEWQIIGGDNQCVTRMTSNMNPSDPMGKNVYNEVWSEEEQNWVNVIDEERSIPLRTPCFKVLPDKANSTLYPPTDKAALAALCQYVAANPNNIYAVFNKYLLGNPTATSGQLEAAEGETATLNVSVDVEGDLSQFKENYADFVFPSLPGTVFYEDTYGSWSWNLARDPYPVGPTTMRAEVEVTYTAKAAITPGTHTTNITVKMAGSNPSSLTIPLSVNALDPDRPEAFWFDGKEEKANGDLSVLLSTDISTYANPILKLNKPVTTDLVFLNKNFTLDMNGNDMQKITVSSGNVTIAYSKYGGSATSLTVNGGKVILNGGMFGSLIIGANGEVEQNGATVTGSATNNGVLTTNEGVFMAGLTSSKTLTVNNGVFNGTTAITISGGTAVINRGTIEGTTCGVKVTAGTTTVKKLAAIKGGTYSAQRTGGTLNIESGKFDGPLNGSINFTSGYFKVNNYGISTEGMTEMLISAGVEYNEGYRYFLGDAETAKLNGVGVCRIGTVSYAKLEDALAYANNNPSVENIVIFMTNDYILPAGNYTLPANATIVVPMSDTQEKEVNKITPCVIFNDQRTETPYTSMLPTEFRRLTFASGVNMEVFGQIELTCSQYASNEAYTSQPVGAYGRLEMAEGSHMTLQNGSELRAWGFLTGKGETDARRGAIVREMFQLGDWKGAMTSVAITGLVKGSENPSLCKIVKGQAKVDDCDYSYKKIFPVTQYFIQNIESPVKYHPGALLLTSAVVSEGLLGMSVHMAATDIKVIGTQKDAIFFMDNEADAENTWVRKWYDAVNDVQVYDVNSSAHIGSMILDMGDINLLTYGTVPIRLNSAEFDLPLTSNFKIHLLSGSMDFKQNTCLLPGAEVEVDKESVVSVAQDPLDTEHTGALYVYDAEDWDQYAYCNEVDADGMSHKGTAFTKVVRYSPSWNGLPTKRDEQTRPADAAINVHGTFNTATGFVYTSNGGANIFSSNEDAGTFVFNESAISAGTRIVNQVKGVKIYDEITFVPAKLKNGDGLYVNTSNANAGDAYCYIEDEWSTMYPDEDNPCFMVKHNVNGDTYFAKPSEYVEIVATKSEGIFSGNSDNTFSDAAGAGRLFILISDPDCQWWEVEKKDNLYHCIHPNNDTYYYWDEDEEKWMEKRFTITWKNWDGNEILFVDPEDPTIVIPYSVTYGTMAEFLGTSPTREPDIDYTYDFTGWSPELAPVTSDVTYTATYEKKERKYTITFLQEGGVEIERQFLPHNAIPVCENMPTKVGHTLVWNPAISPVITDQEYTATWLEELPDKWKVSFVNNAGYLLQEGDVLTTDHPVYSGTTPKKENADHSEYSSNEYICTFNGWSAVIDGVTQTFAPGAELPCPTAPTTYTAVYTQENKTYTITFNNENGELIESHEYKYGETPVCYDIPTKDNTAQYSYSFAWTPQIETVRETKTYTATFTPVENMYTVTLLSNPSEACTFTGAGIYKYNADVAISQTPKDGYTFQKWTNAIGDDVSELPTKVTEDINLVANFLFEGTGHEITWKNWNGNELVKQTYKEGTATTYTGQMPTRPDKDGLTYTFDGWSTTQGGELAYKNNMTPKATAPATYFAHFAATEIPDLNVTGITTLKEPVTKRNLVITSNGNSSGQLLNPNYLTITGKAYFDLTINANANTWYAFGLPWEVNVSGGISDGTRTLSYGNTCYLLEYNGNDRAAQTLDSETGSYWTYVKSGTLKPSKLYMIYLRYPATTLRFTKADGADIVNDEIPISPYVCPADPAESGWNAIANPTTCYAKLVSSDIPSGKGQVYVPGRPNADGTAGDRYDPITLADQQLIVGQPLFVQVNISGDKKMTANGSNQFSAPKRAIKTSNEYEIRIAPAKADFTDRLYVKTAEEKEDRYVIGQDLSKISVANGVAQIWINRYDHKLCFNTTEMINNQAVFPMGISVPTDGHYAISTVTPAVEDEDIFITIDGTPVWNLTQGAYSMDVKAGTTNEYGLLVVYHPTPEISTGCDQLETTDKPSVRKVLINGQVYIIRDGAVYTIFGQKAK